MGKQAAKTRDVSGEASDSPVWADELCRVVRVADPDYPGFCRVIVHAHVREMSDLSPAQQQQLMRVVFAVESALRQLYQPDKINLASLGNVTPHLHWHVIPRWHNDRHFPNPIWAEARQASSAQRAEVSTSALRSALEANLQGLCPND
ncbi:MAG: HIT family protein [Pseudomonadota bacterium]